MLRTMRSRKPESKPLSFSTTMRNPDRIGSFLSCLLPYENKVLTHDIIMNVMHDLIGEKLYTPVIVNRTPELAVILKNDNKKYSNSQIDYIIENSPQQHKEAGFESGWDSRFDTIFKLPMEFGFVKYAMGIPIRISATGHMLIEASNEKEPDVEKMQVTFLNSMMKYQSNNPFRKNANSNVPLVLLLQVLKILKEDSGEKDTGVFRQELSLFICWPDNDAKALYNKIKQIRSEKGYTYSDEYMYEICLELLGATDKQHNRFKLSQLCGEAVDEYIRKMRTTGIISLRGNGRFIDFNAWEIDKINYILNNYSEYETFESRDAYFDYMGSVDAAIMGMKSSGPVDTTDLKKKSLRKFADEYSKDTIYSELYKLCEKKASTDYMLKLLPGPVRMEFLTSVAMVQNFEDADVLPNYTIDDEGLPINTAPGGKPDIVCCDKECQGLVEVTLMHGRHEQVTNEIIPIRRHLLEEKKNNRGNTFSVFVAPVIHEDAKQAAEWYKFKEDLDIVTYNIGDFVETIRKEDKISKLLR